MNRTMIYRKTVEHYEMVLPDQSQVLVEVHHNQEEDGYDVEIIVKNKETNEIIKDFEHRGYINRYLFENTGLLG